MAKSNLSEVKEIVGAPLDDVPTEYLLDDHPANDDYLLGIERLKRQIVQFSDKMKALDVDVCKAKHAQHSTETIADKFALSVEETQKILRKKSSRTLLSLLHYLQVAIQGPQEYQRRVMLWRIACKNEETDPRCTISALAELNKMDNQAQTIEALKNGGAQSGRIEIVVASPALARTPLDG